MLEREKEVIITRDGKPVAKLVRLAATAARRTRFDPVRHARWQAAASRRRVRWVDEFLIAERAAR